MELDELIERMNSDLKKWKSQLEEFRKKYQHLNYYTSEQLLYLRHELTTSSASPKVVSLLQSVTPEPTEASIQTALKHAHKTVLQLDTQQHEQKQEGAPTMALKLYLSPDDLSDEQQQILDTLSKEDFPQKLVLKAIDVLNSDDCEEIRDWCLENEIDYLGEDDGEVSVPDNKVEDVMKIDESHPDVQVLIDEEYPLDIAVKAVREAGGDIMKAREVAQDMESGTYESIKAPQNEEWY